MKKMLLIIALFPAFIKAQDLPKFPIDSETKLITYSEVVNVSGNKNLLYSKSKEWFAKAFVSSKDVIQYDDKEDGKIIGKGFAKGTYTQMLTPVQHEIHFTITIHVKDGRYKYTITNIFDERGSGYNKSTNTIEEYIEMVENKKIGANVIRKQLLPQIDQKLLDVIKSIKLSLELKNQDDTF